MSTTQEADILDVVKRLRLTVNQLDNAHLLSSRVDELNDPLLSALIEKVIGKINVAAKATASLLKHVETNRSYKDLVKKYRTGSVDVDGIESEMEE